MKSPAAEQFIFDPAPAYRPALDPSYLNEMNEIAKVAKLLGLTLMPWQRHALEVATEYRLDSFGRRVYHYSTVLISVPRQSGKTTLVGPLQIHRMMTRQEPAAVWYTAQSGQDARKRIMELVELVEGSQLALAIGSQRSNGAEGLKLKDKPGCHVTRFSPTFSALHGEHPHLVTLDEIWHFTKELGEALVGAIDPAQVTLGRRAQMWMISTMGTLDSEFMNAYVETGRAGTDPKLCYIEYSMPEGLDPFEPATWWKFHPALGNTITEESLQDRADKSQDDPDRRSTWLRAYCNKLTATASSLVDMAIYDDLVNEAVAIPADKSRLTVAYEVAPDNESAAVVAAWLDEETNTPAVSVVHQAPGTAWLLPYIEELAANWGCSLAADGAGPVSRFTELAERAGLFIQTLSFAEYGQSTENLLDLISVERNLAILPPTDGPDILRSQIQAAAVQKSNGVRRFSRDKSAHAIPALIASAVALYALAHPEEEKKPAPLFFPE